LSQPAWACANNRNTLGHSFLLLQKNYSGEKSMPINEGWVFPAEGMQKGL
jgi:hypothetical protein